MYPSPFDYVAPVTLDDALAALAGTPGAKLLAGGQSLLPLLKQHEAPAPPLLVDLMRIAELRPLREAAGAVTIGATLSHADSAASPALAQHAPLLATASGMVADRQVRHRGTVCGALANADPASDECVATLALGGTMLVRSRFGAREVHADDFFTDGHRAALAPDEMLVGVRYAAHRPGDTWGYDKLGVRGGHSGWAVAGCAAALRLGDGTVTAARIAVSGAARVTSLAREAGAALVGTDGSEGAIAAAAARAAGELPLVADLNGSREYKAQLVRVYVARALRQAVARAADGTTRHPAKASPA